MCGSYCKTFPMHASSSLVKGCDNFKCETLTKHLKSKSHNYCRDCYLTRSGSSKPVTQQEALPEVLARQETAQQADLQRAPEIKFNVALYGSERGTAFATAFATQKEQSRHQPNV